MDAERLGSRVAFRVDANDSIGGGHLMRCLSLASELRERDASTVFVMNEPSRAMTALVGEHGFELRQLASGASGETPPTAVDAVERELWDAKATIDCLNDFAFDWVVVDNYELGAMWEVATGARLLVIDDLGREHRCDVLLDQNYYQQPQARYPQLAGTGCILLLGPRYALLRSQFYQRADRVNPRDGTVRQLLVSFGATDPTGETAKVLECLLDFPPGLLHTVALVDSARLPDGLLAKVGERRDIRVLGWVDDVASLMSDADLAIGAGGGTAWERCAVGLPALVVTVADNQRPSMSALAVQGAIRLLGDSSDVSTAVFHHALQECLDCPSRVRTMSDRAAELVPPGRSGAAAVADEMEAVR